MNTKQIEGATEMKRYPNRRSVLSNEEYAEIQHELKNAAEVDDAAGETLENEVNPILAATWTARSGQEIKVYVWGRSITVEVDGEEHEDCEFGSVPPAKVAQAAKLGIVAKIGPVGCTAAQKKAIEAKIK